MTHNNPNSPERTAKAPYNFVPLPDRVVKAQPLPDHDGFYSKTGHDPEIERFSGTIQCELETMAPLYTRAMIDPDLYSLWGENPRALMENAADREKIAQFFNHGDPERPVIPGSTLRGMLRGMVEIITASKVAWVTNRQLVYRAVGDPTALGNRYREILLGPNLRHSPDVQIDYPDPKVKGGYLRQWNGEYYIQPAREILGETFIHVDYSIANPVIGHFGRHEVHDVYVQPASRVHSDRGQRGSGKLWLNIAISPGMVAAGGSVAPAGWEPAKLVETGQMGKYPPLPNQHPKHMHCAIYESDGPLPEKGQPLPTSWLPVPDALWDLYREDMRITREHKNTPRTLDVGEPLFYLVDKTGKLVYFGATMMFRLPYPQSPLDFVPPALRNAEDIDFADAIFGYVQDQKVKGTARQQYAGRVQVSDAKFVAAPNGLWLSPQPVTLKILSGPKPTTFQHYLEQDQPDDRRNLRHYASQTPQETKIRGNKLYWHRGNVGLADIQDQGEDWAEDTQHTQVKPVKAGVKFNFSISFENLSAEELGSLWWALRLPKPFQAGRCHKIGMGKPLGLGAVKITPTLLLKNRVDRYTRLFDDKSQWNPGKAEPQIDFMEKFESFMTAALGVKGPFTATSRIQMLLEMMKFPGPDRTKTEYQDLPVFKFRPVLPDPLHVAPTASTQGNPAGGNVAVPPSTPDTEPKAEDVHTVKVIDASDPKGLWVDIPGLPEKYTGFIRVQDTLGKKYQKGTQIRCKVISLEPDGCGVKVFLKVAPRGAPQ